MSRRAKTLEDHKREGTFRADRHAALLPTADHLLGAVGPPPEDLSPDALQHWRWLCQVVPAEVQSPADYHSFERLARNHAQWRIYIRKAEKAKTKTAALSALRTAMAIERIYNATATQYGLTAMSRTRVKAPVKTEGEGDELDQMHEEAGGIT